MKTDKEIVARQYNAWIYPAPIADMAEWVSQGNIELSDPSLFGLMYWPARADFSGLDILVAGCGTNQAAYIAFKNPHCRVLGVDLSENSLGHQKYLLEKHRLGNLRLAMLDLESLPQLGESFDLIISTGVLHHLPDPDAGLRSLREVLRPDGALYLMLYGKTLRTGVYMLQEAFRLLGLGQSREDVGLVRHVLQGLPPDHAVHAYIKAAGADLQHDTGIVDTFLHPVDQAYTVPGLMDFVARNRLKFMRWQDPGRYALVNAIPSADPLYERAQALPEAAQWQLLDLLTQSKGTHSFACCHEARAEASYRVGFEGDAFLHYVPYATPGLQVVEPADMAKRSNIRLSRNGQEFALDYQAAQLLSQVDDVKTVANILEQTGYLGLPPGQAAEMARALFRHMAVTGHLLYRIPA
jgi:SAM-dependent methyltransferase